MDIIAELTKNETIALWGVIVAAIAGIIVPVIGVLPVDQTKMLVL